MKKFVVALLLLLSITTCFVLGSCAEADVKTTVHLTLKAGTITLYDKDVTVSTAADNTNGPSVLDVLHTIMDNENIQLTFNASGNTLEKAGFYYATDYEDVTYYWSFTINGEEPEAGKADTNYLKAEDKVVYSFVAMTSDANGKVTVSDYDNSTNVFEEILYNAADTEAAE